MALRAREQVKEKLEAFEKRPKGKILHHDKNSVYKAEEWIRKVFLQDQVQPSYSNRGAKGNTSNLESFIGHFKKPNELLFSEVKTKKDLFETLESNQVLEQ